MRGSPLLSPHVQIFLNMPVPQRPDHEQGQTESEYPRKEKMPAPAIGQAVTGRNGRPARKGPCPRASFAILPVSQKTCGFDTHFAQSQITRPFRGADRQPGMIIIGSIFAPVEARMRVENGQTAHQQNEQAQSIDPVPQAGGQAMARCWGNDGLLQHAATLTAGSSLPSPSLHRFTMVNERAREYRRHMHRLFCL